MRISFLLGSGAVAILIIIAIVMGGNIAIFINAPSLLLVIGLPLGIGIAVFGLQDIMQCKIALAGFLYLNKPLDNVAPCRAILSGFITYTYAAGAIGILAGLIHQMVYLEDPSRLGMGMAVSFLTPLYTVVLNECIYRPMLRCVESVAGRPIKPDTAIGPVVSIVTVFLVAIETAILMLSFSSFVE